MQSLKEFRTKALGMPDLLPWAALVDNGIVLTKSGGFIAGFWYSGPDLDSATPAELGNMAARINSALSLGDGWVLNCDAIRVPAPGYAPQGAFNDRTTRLIDDVRRHSHEGERSGFTSHYALTLTWFPESDAASKASDVFVEGKAKGAAARNLDRFKAGVRDVASRLSGVVKIRRMLDTVDEGTGMVQSEILSFFEYCITGSQRPFRMAEVPMYLDAVLGKHDFITGFEPRVGKNHVAALAIEGFPGSSFPGILDFLSRLPIEYRWSNRFIFMDPDQAEKEINKYRSKWSQKRKSAMNVMRENAGGQATHINVHADSMANDAVSAIAEASSGAVRFGYYTSVILLFAEDLALLGETAREVQKVIQNRGFGVRIEDLNAVEAYLGSMPGNSYANVRRPIINTLNLAHLLPFTAVWAGPEHNPCPFYPPNSPPLLYAKTDGSTPFRLCLHAGDLGHTAIIGPTGCHAKGTGILMHDGTIRNVEDVRVGSRVMGPDSKPRIVLRLHSGIDNMVKITPVKGNSFVVNEGHILALKRTNDGTSLAWSTECISVAEYRAKSVTYKHTHKLFRVPIKFPAVAKPLPLSPYVLGVYLGDGCSRSATPIITNPDVEVLSAVVEDMQNVAGSDIHVFRRDTTVQYYSLTGPGGRGRNPATRAIKVVGLYGLGSGEKFIPFQYKTSSHQNRLELLAGLLDTDGHMQNGGFDYVSKSRRLADDVMFLARSLGFAAYLSQCEKGCQTGYVGTYYRVSISGDCSVVPTRIARKKAGQRRQKKSVLTTGFSTKSIGVGTYYGFTVDGDHLYVTSDFTVHHNSGKSTILGTLVAQQFRYPNAQVFAFDKGYSMLPLVWAAGGQHYDIAGEQGDLAFCPLGRIDEPSEQTWAAEWIESLVELQGVAVTPRMRDEIFRSIVQLGQSTTEMGQRTLTNYLMILQTIELRDALRYYTISGAAGHLLDAETDGLGEDVFQVFEMEHLMNLGEKTLLPVLSYLFHRIEQRFKGQPTLLVLDEAWVMLGHPAFKAKIREWLKVLRKANVAVVFATQSLSDLAKSGIADVIFESCPTKILLPNPEAMTENSAPFYHQIGLNTRQVHILASSTPKRQYYVLHPDGRRLFELGLSGPELAFVGASGKEDIARIRELRNIHGDAWPAQWLRERGQFDAAATWESYR